MSRSIHRCPKCKHCWIDGPTSSLPSRVDKGDEIEVAAETQRWRVFLLRREEIIADLKRGLSIAKVGKKYDFNLKGFIEEGAKEQYDDLREALGPKHVSLAIARSGHARRGLAARERRRG